MSHRPVETAPVWHLHLLGQVRVVRGEDIISRFRTRKAEALLAFLAHHRTRPHRREDLLDLLWPDAAPEAARNSLSVALSTLRTQLEGTGDPPRVVFRADRSSIGILREALTTDVEAFETALRSAEAAPEYSAEQIRHLEAAVGLYEAPFLAEHEAAWVEFERQRLAESYGRALHRLAERLAASGQHGQAVERVQRGLAIDPRNELAHADLMSILSALGDVDGALRHFDELQAIAAKDDELVIGRSLRSLAAELRARAAPGHAPAAEPAPWDTRPASRERGQADGGSTDDTGTLSLVVVDGLDDLAALGTVVSEEGGRLLRSVDRGAVFAFGRASEALVCAVRVHRAVAAGAEGGQVVPRLAIHLGEFGRTGRGADEHLPAGAIDDTVVDWALRLAMSAHPGQIVCSEPAAALLRQKLPPGIWMRDLGVYRLAEQAMPERVFQAEYPDMPVRQFAPLNAAGHASRLPQHLTRFFGRERELSHLEDLLLGGEVRLVTVQGPGGTGKSRLCLETAHRLVDVLQGAVWFVPLADVSEGERIPAAIRAALGQPELPGADPLEQVCELLRQRPALLALDNFEHLADVGSGVVGELLERVPRLMCLVSSRRSLGLAGEHAYHLQPLPTPARPYDVDALLSCESVRLFVDRAQAVRADFHLTAGNAEDVAELCGRLEGLPLALELAASRIAVLSLSQMLDKLGQALDLFTTRQRSVPARHRTLRAAIAWSYDLLSPELQDVFARLSVFRGGCTAEAAEAVCAGPAALDHLAALAECSLVEAADGSRVRFRMLDTIRTFAAERLEVQVGAEVRRRHFLHYLALATAGQAALECGEEGDWLERLGAEHENFGAAFDWALEEHPEGALELAGALWRYWLVKGHWADAEQLLARSLERAPQAPPALRARALGWAGHIALRRGHYARAAELLALSLSLCRELDDRPGVGNALNELGKLAWAQGDHRRARTYYEQSLEIREALGNPWSIAATVSNLGVAAWALGDLDAATARLEQALELRRELHDRRGLAGTLRNLGSLAHARGDEAAARRHHEESLSIWRDVGDRAGVAQGLSELGLVAHAEGDFEVAWCHHNESLGIRQQLGDERGIASSLVNLGAVAVVRGEYVRAHELYHESHRISEAIGDRQGTAVALNNLGDVAAILGRPAEATRYYEQGLVLHGEMGDQTQIATLLNNLGEAALASGSWDEARAWFQQSAAAAERAASRYVAAYAVSGLGQVALAVGEPTEARQHHLTSLAIREAIGDRAGVAASLRSIGALMTAEGCLEEASTLLGAAAARRDALNLKLRPAEEREQKALCASLAATLGDAGFGECWSHGRELDFADAVSLARGWLRAPDAEYVLQP